jgi:hypothetical protein
MTAQARRSDAATILSASHAHELWQEAVQVRQEWLDHGLSTRPSDRATAERCLTDIYTRLGRPQPRFEWVDSPEKALPLCPVCRHWTIYIGGSRTRAGRAARRWPVISPWSRPGCGER